MIYTSPALYVQSQSMPDVSTAHCAWQDIVGRLSSFYSGHMVPYKMIGIQPIERRPPTLLFSQQTTFEEQAEPEPTPTMVSGEHPSPMSPVMPSRTMPNRPRRTPTTGSSDCSTPALHGTAVANTSSGRRARCSGGDSEGHGLRSRGGHVPRGGGRKNSERKERIHDAEDATREHGVR